MKWLTTASQLIVNWGGKLIPIEKNSQKGKKVLGLLKNNKSRKKVEEALFPAKRLENFTKGDFKANEDNETIQDSTGSELHPILAKKLLEFVEGSYSYRAFKKFAENLSKNPSEESKEHLYLFLEANHFPITADGCFLAYKQVREENGKLVDTRTSTFNNDPGAIVAMDRSKVNPNRYETCSNGLHVASYNYAKNHYYGGVLLEVKVNPKDVVAVPNDYNNEKMRVCRYEVLKRNEEFVSKSYLNSIYIAGERESKYEIPTFEGMTATQIIERVAKETGITLMILPKDKKRVVRQATEAYVNAAKSDVIDTIDLTGLTTREIVAKIKEQTGVEITNSLKNKQSIIKKACDIIHEQGLRVKI